MKNKSLHKKIKRGDILIIKQCKEEKKKERYLLYMQDFYKTGPRTSERSVEWTLACVQ